MRANCPAHVTVQWRHSEAYKEATCRNGFECPTTGLQKSLTHRVAMATTLGTVVPNFCEPTAGNLVSVTVLAPRIVRWGLHFLNLCTTVLQPNQFSRTH